MTEPSSPAAADELPELPIEREAAPGNRRRVRALWGALAAIAVGVGAVAVQASDDDPPRLPLALGAEGTTKEAAGAADLSMRAYVHYRAGQDLPALGDGGPAYRLSDTADEASVRALAAAVGLEDHLEQEDRVWRATDGTHTLEVHPGFGASWWYGPQDATKSSVDVGADVACPEPADPSLLPPECAAVVTTTLAVAPDLPSRDEATAIALDLLERAGVDTEGAEVTVDGPYDGWYVTVKPELGGLPTGLFSSVTVGEEGEVLYASGVLAEADELGDYATVDTGEAIDRLNEGMGGFAGAGSASDAVAEAPEMSEPLIVEECAASSDGTEICTPATSGPLGRIEPAEPSEPIEVVLHEAEPILMLVGATDGSDDGYLVPGYRFTGDDGTVVDQIAIADDALAPVDVPDGGPADTGSIEPAVDPAPGASSAGDPGPAGGGSSGYDPDGSVSSPVQPEPGQVTPTAPTTPCTLPAPGPNGEVPLIGCAEPAAG